MNVQLTNKTHDTMKHEIFGISTDSDNVKFSDVFEEIYDNDENELCFQSKETFQHREEGLNFDYKYVVEVDDIDAITGEETGEYDVSLHMVPLFDSLCEKERKRVAESCCVSEPDCYDCLSYGIEVLFGNETVAHNGKSMDECEELQEKLSAIANVFRSIDGLRGFYLDQYVNRIGTTGSDLLNDYINGVDFIQATLARHENKS